MLALVQNRRAKSNQYGTYLDSSLNLSLLTLPSCQEWATMRSITNYSAYIARYELPRQYPGQTNLWFSFDYAQLHVAYFSS